MVSIPTWKWSEIGKGKRSEIYIRSMNSRIYVKLCMWIIGIDSYSVYLVASKFNISFVHVDGLPRQQIYNRYWFLLRTNLLDPNSPRGSSGLKNELVHISAVLSVIGCKLIPLLTKNVNPYWVDLNPWTSIGETWSYWVMRRKEVCKHEYWLHRTRADVVWNPDVWITDVQLYVSWLEISCRWETPELAHIKTFHASIQGEAIKTNTPCFTGWYGRPHSLQHNQWQHLNRPVISSNEIKPSSALISSQSTSSASLVDLFAVRIDSSGSLPLPSFLTLYLSPSRDPSFQALEPFHSASHRTRTWADCRRATRPGLVIVSVYWICIGVTTTAEHQISWCESSQPQSHHHSSSCWRLPTPVSSNVGHILRRVTCRRGYQGRVSRSQQLQRIIPTDADKKERPSNRLRGTDV